MTPDEIAELRALAATLTRCALVWEPNARLIGNMRAAEIADFANTVPRLCDEIERLRADVERLSVIVGAAKVVAFRGEHTGDCIGASGGACFEDDRDECECGLTTLRNALKGRE